MPISIPVLMGEANSNAHSANTEILCDQASASVGDAVAVVLYGKYWGDLPHQDMEVTDSAGNTYTHLATSGFSSDFWGFYGLWANFGLTYALSAPSTMTISHGLTDVERVGHVIRINGVNSFVANWGSERRDYAREISSGYGASTSGEVLMLGIAGWHTNGGVIPTHQNWEPWVTLRETIQTNRRFKSSYKLLTTEYVNRYGGPLSDYAYYYAAQFGFRAVDTRRQILISDSGLGVDAFSVQGGNRTITISDVGYGTDTVGGSGGSAVVGAPNSVTVGEVGRGFDRFTVRDQGATQELRLGTRVPEGGVNLAWLQIPPLLPTENLSLIDTASFVAENENLTWKEPLPTGSGYLSDSGYVYKTVYNPASTASGLVSEGPGSYELTRQPEGRSGPAGFTLQQFTSQIRVLHPQGGADGLGWYLRVQDGLVVRRHLLTSGDTSWLARVFNPGDELVLYYTVVESQSLPVDDDSVLQVTLPVTDLDGSSLHLPYADVWEVSSLQVNGQELLGSGDPLTRESPLPHGPIKDWDYETGRLTLSRELDPDGEVQVTFKYQEFLLRYHGYHDETEGRFRDLDLNPEQGHTYDGGRLTRELLNRPVYLYLIPSAAYRRSRLNADGSRTPEPDRVLYSGTRFTASFLRWQVGAQLEERQEYAGESPEETETPTPPDPCKKRSTFGYTTFARAYFVDDVPLDTELPTPDPDDPTGGGLAGMPSALLLAKVYVAPNSQVDNLQVVDTRVRGGGVPEEIDVTDIHLPGKTRQQAETYWDIGGWDGQPAPLAGVLIVDLPEGVRNGSNGYPQYSEEEILAIAQRHVAAGVRVVIRYV